jgi:hypothetical protein
MKYTLTESKNGYDLYRSYRSGSFTYSWRCDLLVC